MSNLMLDHNSYQSNNLLYKHESPIWFSHVERKREVKRNWYGKKKFKWTEISELWDWDNCLVSAVKVNEEKIRIIIRSSNGVFSDYRKKDIKLKYMLGFDIDRIGILEEDEYNEPTPEGNPNKLKGKKRPRLVLKLDKYHCIWQWKESAATLDTSELAIIFKELKNVENEPYDPIKSNIFYAESEQENNNVLPVIYQPAVDSLKNFLREVHVNRLDDKRIEVTLVFNNEHLSKHKYLDKIYRIIRLLIYRRIADLESFVINLENAVPERFQFACIYSGSKGLQYDDVHEDKSDNGIVPYHKIKYFFVTNRHPIVFVNTANHAMSYHDTNHRIWKWEYIPWEEEGPVILGNKSREELESAKWEIYSEDWISQYWK
jgi:hypothetical protein